MIVDVLVHDIGNRRPDDITSFADHLARTLHAAAADAYGDAFLYIRCVVAAVAPHTSGSGGSPTAIAAFTDQDAEPRDRR